MESVGRSYTDGTRIPRAATIFDYETNASTYSIEPDSTQPFCGISKPPWIRNDRNPITFTNWEAQSRKPAEIPMNSEHNVTLTRGFYLGKYEVTQAQYEAVMTGNTNGLSATPSQFSGNPNRPVEKVSWNDIQIFLTRLNN